jgi:hypothetical protein
MRAVVPHAFKEYFRVEAFAKQPPEVVCEADDHRPDLIPLNQVS